MEFLILSASIPELTMLILFTVLNDVNGVNQRNPTRDINGINQISIVNQDTVKIRFISGLC